MVSAIDAAKRVLVSLLKTLAAAYGLTIGLARESSDTDVRSAYRKLSRKTHPDRGGKAEDQVALNSAFSAWEDALKNRENAGRKTWALQR